MKKILILLMISILLCGCGKTKLPDDACDFLIQAEWEGNDAQCVNAIRFQKDKSFSNWCFCGSPVGDGDLVEEFRYRASDKTILLLDCDGEIVETGKILYVDDFYLVIDVWGSCYVYENVKKERPVPNVDALEIVGTEELTKPCLSILGYEDGKITVASCDYDGDAKDDFETWSFEMRKNAKVLAVNVTVHNGVTTVESQEVEKSEYQNIGEAYTYGYVEIDASGKVSSIVFYGETVVED